MITLMTPLYNRSRYALPRDGSFHFYTINEQRALLDKTTTTSKWTFMRVPVLLDITSSGGV